MATETLKVRIDAAINAEATLKTLRELKQLQKETVAGSADYKKIQARINDIGDAAKTAKGQSEDWIDALAGAGGPIGMLGRGLDTITSSTNKFGLALKATGIGLIVALVGQLVAAFTSNEKAMKKLEPVMIAFEQILGGIFAALEPVFDLFVELALKVMPVLQKAIGGLYTAFAALGSFLKNFITIQVKNFMAFGKILKGVFTLDFDTIKEGFNDIGNNIKEGVKNVVDTTTGTWDRYNKGLKETTKTQKKNLEEQNKANQDNINKQKEQIESLLKSREADLAKQKAIAMDAAKTEKERFEIEKKFAEDTYLAKKKALEETRKLYPQGSKEYKDYTSQLTTLEADYITKKTEFRNKDKEQEKKDFDELVKASQDANKRKVDDLTATYNLQKEKYGENSKEARDAQDKIFATQLEGLENERKLYENKKELSKEESARLEEIKTAQTNLTTAILTENEKRKKSDLETSLKNAETKKKETDDLFAENMRKAEGDLEQQQSLLDAKRALDEQYYTEQLSREGLTADQIKAIKDKQLADTRANAEAQILIEQKKFDAQQKLLGATATAINAVADIVGKNTVAGKALAVAASLINTYAAIAGQLKAFAGVPVPGYAIVQAVATGIVGFKAVADIIKTPVPAGGDKGTTPQATGTAVPRPRGMATGGLVQGIGGPKSDLIPAMLSNGESVINANSTSMFRPLLSTINSIGGGKRFADGGLAVGGFSQTQAMNDLQSTLMSQQQPIKTYVVASDMTSNQMLDRNIKSRSTI